LLDVAKLFVAGRLIGPARPICTGYSKDACVRF